MYEPTDQPPPTTAQISAPRSVDPSVQADVEGIRDDLDQLARLLDDAAARLTSSFESVAELAARQRLLIDCRADTRLAALGVGIDDGVAGAITALQFHDIASQILGHIGTRIDVLHRLETMRRIDRGASTVPGRADTGNECTCSRAVKVTQASMHVGAVELF